MHEIVHETGAERCHFVHSLNRESAKNARKTTNFGHLTGVDIVEVTDSNSVSPTPETTRKAPPNPAFRGAFFVPIPPVAEVARSRSRQTLEPLSNERRTDKREQSGKRRENRTCCPQSFIRSRPTNHVGSADRRRCISQHRDMAVWLCR